jgi:FPC/CPF motif-containing protein YcgG
MLHSPRLVQRATPQTSDDASNPLVAEFRAFIADGPFPCLGAKAALHQGGLRTVIARDIRSDADDLLILLSLVDHARRRRRPRHLFRSLAVLFEQRAELSEEQFERALWTRLQSMSEIDVAMGHGPDPRVARDPDDPSFAISFGGEAYFVIGLHPRSSRRVRRFTTQALVFNLHDQFERLRAEGRYDKLRAAIADRDRVFSGSINTMLADHGSVSAARQYSGRPVGDDWHCPFRPPDRSS